MTAQQTAGDAVVVTIPVELPLNHEGEIALHEDARGFYTRLTSAQPDHEDTDTPTRIRFGRISEADAITLFAWMARNLRQLQPV